MNSSHTSGMSDSQSKQSRRDTSYNRRKNVTYSNNAPKVIRGLIFFGNNHQYSREETVIRRMNAFLPQNQLVKFPAYQLITSRYLIYRKLAISAILEFIRSFPFLNHTPSTLRATFGMPTRKDRDKGLLSSIELLSKALHWDDPSHTNRVALPELPSGDQRSIDALKLVLKNNIHQSPMLKILLTYLESILDNNPLRELFIPEINTHSNLSLERTKNLLASKGFEKISYDIVLSNSQKLTPDLIAEYDNKQVYVELKEWDAKINRKLFLKPLKQLLNYLLEAEIVVLICPNKIFFKEFLVTQDFWDINELDNAIDRRISKLSVQNQQINDRKYSLIEDSNKLFVEKKLTARMEALLATLISAVTHEELGVVTSELEAGAAVKKLLKQIKTKTNNLCVFSLDKLPKKLSAKNPILIVGELPEEERISEISLNKNL